MKDLNERILEIISENVNEDDAPSFGIDDNKNDSEKEETTEETSEEDSKEDNENNDDSNEKEEKEEFHANDIHDFLNKTKSKISITKTSTEPSPIFGPHDTKNHNKYKVTIRNEKGNVWFVFWDSIHNTENNKTPTVDDVMSCFGLDVGMVNDGISLDEFKSNCGYDETEDKIAQKAYDGCRKMLGRAKKLYDDGQISELLRLASEH